ncbi:MAG: single-stranded-DNA-specific exonuclease RecJ [Candidatus Ruminococcus intestinipullorum]|nr:single-stranded-DNA-specific exonuclease RecJ [Candidatus Ruminococcus intestinipullorum]
MQKWFVTMKKADFEAIAKKYQISPMLARLIRNRDIIGDDNIANYLNGTEADLHDGFLMKDMKRAIAILSNKIQEGKKIRVMGDYDIDGVNASYILKEGLQKLGACVDTDIPDRMKDGYGLSKLLIDRAILDGVDTIITCDNGIAAYDEIEYGKQQKLTIIVTDHHEIPYQEYDGRKEYIIPKADAVVNPHQIDCSYPFKGLCGAAVAYKVIESLYKEKGKSLEEIEYLIQNVAIATIGDVMDLVGENRIFVKKGLRLLKTTENLGLKALMECNQIDKNRLSSYHIGFIIGPCINASGRLDTAKRALELLEAKTTRDAVRIAEDLKVLNDNRKELTEKGVEQAVKLIETTSVGKDRVLVIYLPDCHESIAGIIAGRIKERYYKPTFVLTKAEHGVKGSGRSIEAYNMYEEMCKCKTIFTKFGGHKLAAGLSLEEENVESFRQKINELAQLTDEDLCPKVSIDMRLPFSFISEEFIQELELLEPFGKGNSKPVFAEKNIRVRNPRIIGKNKNVLKFQAEDLNGNKIDAIYFGDVQKCMEYMQSQEQLSVTYYPAVNEFQGNKTLQIIVENYL